MEHVVFFPAPDGSPAFRRVSGLDEAVRLVEHLRNVEGVSTVSVHTLTEVPLSFRAYYRVEVPDGVQATPLVPAQPIALEPDALAGVVPDVVAVQHPVETPGLALVADVPLEEPVLVAAEPAAHEAVDEEVHEDRPQPAPASLGFFA